MLDVLQSPHTISPQRGRVRPVRRAAMRGLLVVGLLVAPPVLAQDGPARAELVIPEMTAQEKMGKGEEYVRVMTELLQKAVAVVEEARAANDVEQLGVVRDAVTAMRGLLKMADQSLTALRSAAGRGDRKSVDNEFVKISIAYNKFLELDSKVRTSSGVAAGQAATGEGSGGASVQAQADGDVPVLNIDSGVQSLGVLLDRPPSASGAE